MNRDGHLESLWQHAIPDYQSINSWEKETVYDVLIVGAGITGISTGLQLQKAGLKCVIAEAHTIGFGTTSGTTAHLNTMLDATYDVVEKDFGADAAKLLAKGAASAIEQVRSNVEEYNIDCDFEYKPAYLYAGKEDEVAGLTSIKEGFERAGLSASWTDHSPLPIPFVRVARFEQQAQFHVTKYLSAMAGVYERAGGVLLQHCLVQDAAHPGAHFEVSTTLGTIKAKKLVYATHIPPGINILHFRCAPYRSYAAAFTLKSGDYPTALAYDMEDPYHYFRTHTVDGQQYVIGGGFDHKTGHEENTEAVFLKLEAYLRTYFDIDTIAYRWSSQYYNPADGLPYIGLLPGHNDTYVATGFGGNGLIFGTLAANVLRDILTGKETPYEALFKPSRVKPVAGFMEFIKENADVVSQFVGKRFAYEKVNELADLAPGEAKLADWEGKKVALYKDSSGKVFGVDPVCPHAKCIVGWNSAEESWDCPCHGARYAPNGDLLTGPARHGLEPIIWEQMDGD